MNRPYMICHILSAVNGKISGPFMGMPGTRTMSAEYARIREAYQADGWLYGTVTTKEFTQHRKPVLKETITAVPEGDYIADKNASLYYISVDAAGEIGWESGTFRKEGRPDSHVIEILTGQTPVVYRAYLREHGVSYILAGESELDCTIAAEKLYSLFGIGMVLICGGGAVNWTFLQQGVVDELSLLLAPAADGESSTPSIFEKSELLQSSVPVEFALKNVEHLGKNGVRLVYMVQSRTEKD